MESVKCSSLKMVTPLKLSHICQKDNTGLKVYNVYEEDIHVTNSCDMVCPVVDKLLCVSGPNE